LKISLLIPSLLSLCGASTLIAEPYIAVREGLKCSACHTNITGGGKRTQMGTGYGAIDLPWKPADLQSQKIPHYFSLINDLLSVGADFRALNRSTFSDGGSETNTFQTDKSNLYLQADLIRDRLTFYLDETIAPGGAQTREIFGMFHNLPGRGWIKAGKFIHPFGLRMEDDRAFIREATGFNFNNPDTGVEIGFQPGPFTMMASITNGTSSIVDNNLSKQFVGTFGYIGDSFRIGTSASYNDAGDANRRVHGGWAGLRIKDFVFLGEADWIRDEELARDRDQIVTYAELDYEFTDGWNLKIAYEFYDPDRNVDENERDRVITGIESFLTSFVQLQLFYRFNQSIPQNVPQNADELLLRLHIYF
jgi:hypothetical protein